MQLANAQANYHRVCLKTYQEQINLIEGIDEKQNHNVYNQNKKIRTLVGVDMRDMSSLSRVLPPEKDKKTIGELDDLEILKMGILEYRYMSLGVKTWKPLFALLSGRGVLHLFQKQGDDKPILTIGLRCCSINLAPSIHPNAFRIMEQMPSLLGGQKLKKHAIKTGKSATMAEWMAVLKQFLLNKTVEFTDKEMRKFNKLRLEQARKMRLRKKAMQHRGGGRK
uniref:PH domain-containing protein n=1 Tax=Lotharella oceanica TaxID=641309 RepID=A0A7S2U003_9EUKA|mmetsp:Transcript_35800/g.66243  ORF Transcript_35800/g.66243 Transcript_35800/m.66243 type:complete len:223 (+) Transcript_35800:1-669(+)